MLAVRCDNAYIFSAEAFGLEKLDEKIKKATDVER
jgi:hypothetical protein